MKNLWSYCGLVDAKIRASDKDLPVTTEGGLQGFGQTGVSQNLLYLLYSVAFNL
jgi:hypothetical protein